MEREIDELATTVATNRYGLLPSLHIPIAARDEQAIQRFIGRIINVLITGTPNRALLVEPFAPPTRDASLSVWAHANAPTLHAPRQVWVHVDYRGYRSAYAKAFPQVGLTGLVLDHILNRRVARLKGFTFLRVVPISKGANSSSGGLSEKWAVTHHSAAAAVQGSNKEMPFIQYADVADITKMLNIKTGNSVQDGVNETLRLIMPRGTGE